MSKTNSLISVETFDQGFLSNEMEDLYASHLDLNQFCTVDNELEGVAGDIRKINVYGASGDAEDVAEGQGNANSIATTLVEREYRIKTAQAWFGYSDEAAMRDPKAIQTGLTRLGISLFDKVNADIFAEMEKATNLITPSTYDFDALVDAVAEMSITDANEPVIEVQGRFIPTVWAITDKKGIAKARKAMKDQIVYDPRLAWEQGYVGSIAGVALFYKQNLPENIMYVGTKEAVTVFNKTGVQTEIAARGAVSANTRANNVFARKYYIAALTNPTQIVQIVLSGGSANLLQKEVGDGATVAFTLDETATDTPIVAINGVVQESGYSFGSNTVTFSTAPAANDVITFTYHYTVS